MSRAFEREDGPEDPPEDFAHSIHTCGWNGSLRVFRSAGRHHKGQPCPAPLRQRLDALRAELLAKVAQQRARGLIA
jgi:hypothetical protein